MYLLYTELRLNLKSPPEIQNTPDQTQHYVNISTDVLDSAQLILHFLSAHMRDTKYTYRISWRHFPIILIFPPFTISTCIHINVCKPFLGEAKKMSPYCRVFLLVYPCHFLSTSFFLGEAVLKKNPFPTKLLLKVEKHLHQLCLGPCGYRAPLVQAVPHSGTVALVLILTLFSGIPASIY